MKLKLLLILVATCMMATNTFAADYNWTPAAESTDFTLSTNWTPARTSPADTDNLIFDGNSCGASTTAIFTNSFTVNSLTVRNNCSVKLWANAGNTLSRIITISATSNGFNIEAGSVLDLGKSYFSLTNGQSVAVSTTSYTGGTPNANMVTTDATKLGKIAAGQIAVGVGVLSKGAKVVSIDYVTGAIVFDKNFVSSGTGTQLFFFPPTCSGTGTVKLNGTTSSQSYYHSFTVEFYHPGAQTLYDGYYSNLKLSGNRASTVIAMSNNYFLENLDVTGLSNYSITGTNAVYYFIGSANQNMLTGFTTAISAINADGVDVTLGENTTANGVKLYNGSKVFLGDYNLTMANTTTTNYVSSATAYFVTNGTGVVSRTWAAANKAALNIYIGASATSSDPVTITPGVNGMTFTARVGFTLSGSAASGKAYNAKEWVITPSAAGAATIKLSPSVSTFINTPIIGSWNGSSYTDASATLSGTADPYGYSASISLSSGANKLTTGGAGVISTGGNISGLGLDANKGLYVSSGELTVDATTPVNKITVAPGAKLTLNNGQTLTTTNGINLQSDATGTATLLNSGTYTGTINAQQYLGAARNWYVCSPVSSATAPSTNITRYYEYVEAGNNADFSVTGSTVYWKGLNTGTTMAVGKGYIAQASAVTTVQFSGTPNNGDITTAFNLTRNDSKGKGFNLVGNPYPSYLDWVDVAAANSNLDNTYYYRTKNSTNGYTFVTWNGAGSNYVVSNGSLPVNTAVTRYIPPTQAFWVRVKSGTSTTTMSFTNAMREHRDDNGNLMKAPKQNTRTSVRLQLQNGTESDELLIYQDEAASNSYDAFDSPKMMNNSSVVPDLYSKVGDERLVINGLNAIVDNMELPLGFSLNAAASLKLKATELSNFPVGTRIYLLDKVESTQVELLPETEYSFTTTATTNNESRFSLLFKAPGVSTGTTNTEKEQISVFVNTQNQITIIAKPNSNYSIYNATGQLIENGTVNSELKTQNPKLAAGVYVVKVNNHSTRVIIK